MTRRQKLIGAGGVLFSVLAYLVTQFSMLATRSDWNIDIFRGYYEGDQLSYLAMVVNGASGDFAAVEPFTQTGANNYPHLWYTVLGWFAHVTGVSPMAAWTIGGLALQCLLVAAVSVSALLVTRRALTAYAGFLPLIIGTFSWVISGGWQTQMDSHAVLWGSFAVLFTLNGEAAALCVAGIAALATVTGASRGLGTRGWVILGTCVGLAIGVLANVQTYSFLTGTYLVLFGIAVYGLASRPRIWPIALSIALGIAVFVFGPLVAPGLGQLLTLTVGLAPAVPGLIAVLIRSKGLFAIPALAAVLAASPQIVGTFLALRAGDPFLSYRVSSSKDLGVFWQLGIVCAIAVLVPLAMILTAGILRRNKLWISYPLAIVAAWVILAKNDVWGANQEPYRFWIDCFMLTAVTMVPLAAHVIVTFWPKRSEPRRRSTTAVRVLALLSAVLIVASSVDWAWFFVNERRLPLISFRTSMSTAISTAAAGAGDELVLVDNCVVPLYFKPAGGGRVVYYNLGMAWPQKQVAIQDVLSARELSELASPEKLEAADVHWVLTDSRCPVEWPERYADRLSKETEADFSGAPDGSGTITLWRVD